MIETYLNLTQGASYHDIPQPDQLKKFYGIEDKNLLLSAYKYHQVIVADYKHLQRKENLLNDVVESMEQVDFFHKEALAKVALAKRKHLKGLLYLWQNDIISESHPLYHENLVRDYFVSEREDLLPMVNEEKFDYDNCTRFGEYWLEVIDPSHRLCIDFYKRIWERQKIKTPFLFWMEQNDGFSNMHTVEYGKVFYDSVNIKDGVLFSKNSPYQTKSGKDTIFVITEDAEIRAGVTTATYKHSSLTNGRPVIGVGSFQVEDGYISYLESSSGHYLPREKDFMRLMEFFAKNNVDLTHAEITYFDNHSNFKTYRKPLELQAYRAKGVSQAGL